MHWLGCPLTFSSWSRVRTRGLLLLLILSGTFAGAQAPAVPDTPAGKTLQTWLAMMASGDRTVVERYVHDVDPKENVDGLVGFHGMTGGFDLLSIESSEPLHVRFLVKEKDGPTQAFGNLLVKAADKPGASPTVVNFGLRAIPPGVKPVNVVLDSALRQRVLREIEAQVTEAYIDAALGEKMNAALAAHERAGDYNAIADPDVFANRLADDMKAASHDKHLNVGFSPFKEPERKAPTPEDVARQRTEVLRDGCAFKKVDILPNNIGYLKFDGFMAADLCAPTASAAMQLLAHTSALIIDLRENGGGDPAMVSYIATYLFDKPTHLNDLYYRKTNDTHQFWTLPSVPGDRLAEEPVFVLTSGRTFSGAEEFSYDMQTQKRATLVGETTGGGAHPVSGVPIADYFVLILPEGKPINPVTHGDWEGKGITPEVKVPAAEALSTAEKLAVEKIQAKEKTTH